MRIYKLPKLFVPIMTVFLIIFLIVPSTSQAKIEFKGDLGVKKYKVQFFGFFQTEGRYGKAYGTDRDGLFFKAQRIRWGTKYRYGNIFGKLFLDFNKSHTKTGAGLPEMIKDAWTGYYVSDALFVKLGMTKAPIGMGFTIPGWNLDIIERNKLDKGLVIERDMGLIASGRFIGMEGGKASPQQMGHEKSGYGFGYDVGVFNPAGRCASVKRQSEMAEPTLRDALTLVGRLHFDYGEPLHAEAAYAISQQAGGMGTEDFNVFDVAFHSHVTPQINLKGEFISGQNIKGVKDDNHQCLTGTFGYHVNPFVEVTVKQYYATANLPNGDESTLGNTYISLNVFFTDFGITIDELDRSKRRSLQKNRFMINLILAQGGDDWMGHWGYTDTGIGFQLQHKF